MKIYDHKPGTMAPWSGMSKLKRANTKGTHCDNCGGQVNRPPSQCTGKTVCCSRSCAAELKKIRIVHNCVVCGKAMEHKPSRAVAIVTCSAACRSARASYDTSRNAPRFTGGSKTRDQVCKDSSLTRNQFRYREETGRALGSALVHECGIRDTESNRSWKSLSACARELGVSVTAVHNAIKRNGRVSGVLVARTTPAMPGRIGR